MLWHTDGEIFSWPTTTMARQGHQSGSDSGFSSLGMVMCQSAILPLASPAPQLLCLPLFLSCVSSSHRPDLGRCLMESPCFGSIADVVQSHGGVFVDSSYPSSPITAPPCRGLRRASEVSIASQVSGMADSYTATNIANSKCSHNNPTLSSCISLSPSLYLPPTGSFSFSPHCTTLHLSTITTNGAQAAVMVLVHVLTSYTHPAQPSRTEPATSNLDAWSLKHQPIVTIPMQLHTFYMAITIHAEYLFLIIADNLFQAGSVLSLNQSFYPQTGPSIDIGGEWGGEKTKCISWTRVCNACKDTNCLPYSHITVSCSVLSAESIQLQCLVSVLYPRIGLFLSLSSLLPR